MPANSETKLALAWNSVHLKNEATGKYNAAGVVLFEGMSKYEVERSEKE